METQEDKFVCVHGIECDVSLYMGWQVVLHKNPNGNKEYCPVYNQMNTLRFSEILEAIGAEGNRHFDPELMAQSAKILALSKVDAANDNGISDVFKAISESHRPFESKKKETDEKESYMSLKDIDRDVSDKMENAQRIRDLVFAEWNEKEDE